MADLDLVPQNAQVNEIRLEMGESNIYIEFIESDKVADLRRIIAAKYFPKSNVSNIKIVMKDLTVKDPSYIIVDDTLEVSKIVDDHLSLKVISSDPPIQLSDEDFAYAYQLHKEHPNWSFENLQKELSLSLKKTLIKFIEPDLFKDMCTLAFAQIKGNKNSETHLNMFELYNAKTQFLSNRSNILKEHCPGEPSLDGPWAECEKKQLLSVVSTIDKKTFKTENDGVDWAQISRLLPGRTGEQCRQEYQYLRSKGQINTNLNETRVYSPEFLTNQIPGLGPDEEFKLVQKILSEMKHEKSVSRDDVSQWANEFSWAPECIARKALLIDYIRKSIPIIDKNGMINPDYQDEFDQKLEEFVQLATDEPQKLLEDYQIPNFLASPSWTLGFLHRNRFNFKAPHTERRGPIDEEFADSYLFTLAQAIDHYGPDHVFNMDETHIPIYNPPKKVISPVGQDVVLSYYKYNKKEGFTAIGTISLTRKFPIIVLGQGKTSNCCKKFKFQGSELEYYYSEDGWCTTKFMIHYLRSLSEKVNGDPFALVLDAFSAHWTKEVRREARRLKIQLIQVPANGTGIYQPLDVNIFGPLKAKLTKFENQDHILQNEKDYQKRHQLVCKNLQRAWDEIDLQIIAEAWDKVSGLKKARDLVTIRESKDSEYVPQ